MPDSLPNLPDLRCLNVQYLITVLELTPSLLLLLLLLLFSCFFFMRRGRCLWCCYVFMEAWGEIKAVRPQVARRTNCIINSEAYFSTGNVSMFSCLDWGRFHWFRHHHYRKSIWRRYQCLVLINIYNLMILCHRLKNNAQKFSDHVIFIRFVRVPTD